MKKILIVKTSAIGDIIHTFPALQLLREIYPDARIDWVVEKAGYPLLKAHPYISGVLLFDWKQIRKKLFSKEGRERFSQFIKNLRKEKYDFVFDFQGNTKSALVTVLAKSKEKIGFGAQTCAEKPNLIATNCKYNPAKGINIREKYLYLVKRYCRYEKPFYPRGIAFKASDKETEKNRLFCEIRKKSAKKVMVCFGSNWKNKMVTTDALIAFLHRIYEVKDVHYFFVFGDDAEKLKAEKFQMQFPKDSTTCGGMTLPQWQNLMGEMDLVISVDSAALHLAETAGTPTYSIFGPSQSRVYQPLDQQKHRSFQGACPYGKTFDSRCPILRSCKTGSCLRAQRGDVLATHFFEQELL